MDDITTGLDAGIDQRLESTSDQDKFVAIHNFQPPMPPSLRVTGTVEVPTLGYTAELIKADPQGINPDILLLDLKVTAPEGFAGQSFETLPVEYHEVTDVKYVQVEIQPGDITVSVQDVT